MAAKKDALRSARVHLMKVVLGQMIGREVVVEARNDSEARSAARAIAGPLYEVERVTWIN